MAQTDADITPEAHPPEPPVFKVIRFDQIRFRYEANNGSPFTLGPLDLAINAGETIFITGGNGSGKSTLLKVITGLYAADSGQVSIDGRGINITDHRRLFSVVFTDFHLFDRFYGLGDIGPERLNPLLERMHLETKVGFDGKRLDLSALSTGQGKRMALIAALLEDRPILVFDEWAADQDPYFKRYFYRELLVEFKNRGKTVIAVTHDDRFFDAADQIFRLDYGRLFCL